METEGARGGRKKKEEWGTHKLKERCTSDSTRGVGGVGGGWRQDKGTVILTAASSDGHRESR